MTTVAMYQSIALDVAHRIINSEFSVGNKISGRTLLASHYNVSSETVRKAVALLKDANVVAVSQGKEVLVLSVEAAYHFIEHHKSMESVSSLKQELEILVDQKRGIDNRLEEVLNQIIGYSDRLKNLTPYNPIEVQIPAHAAIIGKTIAEIRFWQHTGATIVAIRRGKEIIISPGPLAVLAPYDKLVIVGKPDGLEQVMEFVNRPVHDSQ